MALDIVRCAGNLAVAAFFSADKDKKRHEKREDYKTALGDSKNDPGAGSCLPNKSICLYNRCIAWKIRDEAGLISEMTRSISGQGHHDDLIPVEAERKQWHEAFGRVADAVDISIQRLLTRGIRRYHLSTY